MAVTCQGQAENLVQIGHKGGAVRSDTASAASGSKSRNASYPGDVTSLPVNRLPRAWYDAPLPRFLTTTPDTILGALTRASGDHAVEPAQTQAWLAEIALLKSWLAPFRHGTVFLEFTIPRMGRRIDAVLLLGELAERSLFFASVSPDTMPGTPP